MPVLVVTHLDLEVDEGETHAGQFLLQDLAHLHQDAQGLVILAGGQQTLHDAQPLADEGVALLVVLQGDLGVGRIEHDALLHAEALGEGAGGDVADDDLQRYNGDLLYQGLTLGELLNKVVGTPCCSSSWNM